MKTKLLFGALIFSLLTETSFAQPYVPMLNNSTWNLVSSNFGGNQNLILGPGTDAVIGSYAYKKYTDPTIYSTDNYVREDVAAKKVYRNVNGVDQLLYDFSLQVGNHITLSDGRDYTVSSITNVNVNGGQRRMFYLINYIGTFAGHSETWIEGVGSSRHPLKPAFEMYLSDPYIFTSCSAQNGVNVYNSGIANGQPTPTDCSMLLGIEAVPTQSVVFSPNPFRTQLFVTSNSDFENATIKIFNAVGQLVREINNINSGNVTIERENLACGIYLAQLTQNEKVSSTRKIIVSD